MKHNPLFLFLIFISISLSASATTESNPKMVRTDKLVGNIIKNALETYHFRKLKIDDSVSQKAFTEYLKKVDYGKQFLFKADVKNLKKYQFKLDDQMISGELGLLDTTQGIISKRILLAESLRKKIFKGQFNFDKNESFELDPEKRGWLKDEKAFAEHWRKIFKQSTLSRYLSFLDADSDDGDKKKKKKKKVEKKLTKKEMITKSHDAISKKYKRYFERLKKENHDDFVERFFNSIAAIFDPHTSYLPPKRKEDFDIDISGSLEGIGAVLQEDGAYIKVVKVVPGGAAWRQKGLEVDDVILLVAQEDGVTTDLVDMRVDDAVRFIRGKKGTVVKLTVKKADGTRKVIPIERDVVQLGASFAKSSVLEHKKLGVKIGYIQVPKFYRDFSSGDKNCTNDVRDELNRLKKQNVKAMILDLRNNGGGALEDAKQMSGLFIPKGPIVQIKNHNGQIDVLTDTDTSTTYNGPLIVMINRFSASASEILAGALQDYGRAVIVGGEHSHGKGTVQAVLNLNQGNLLSRFWPEMGALKVTIQKFYRITGVSTQYKGITPDIILPDPMAYADNREQDLDYSLPFDKVRAKKFSPWKDIKYDIRKLKKKSGKRVSDSSKFTKVVKSIEYLTKRKDDTKVSLNITKVQAEDKKNKEFAEKFKLDEQNKDILVTNFEPSLKAHEKVRPGDEKQWRKDFEQRKEEWVKSLQQDIGLEESIFIINDILDSAGMLSMK
ncbi:MAG: carboxy terminal-processing peptidase [Halobacteriovoraceae bacterium]|nr:carboxy terminal-processing peptidase [Halobacteriovoraceae bacterium]